MKNLIDIQTGEMNDSHDILEGDVNLNCVTLTLVAEPHNVNDISICSTL